MVRAPTRFDNFPRLQFKILEESPSAESINCFTHGQYPGAGIRGTYGVSNSHGKITDDHQSPVRPTEYLQLRVLPLLNFYKGDCVRLPRQLLTLSSAP